MSSSAIHNLSLIIITLNEAENLPRLLASVPAGVEVIVLDSFSSDQTVEIAKKHNAFTSTQKFEDYSSQKNTSLKLATKDWVLSLDADEVPTLDCWQEIQKIVLENDQSNAWEIVRQQIFLGRKLRFGKSSDAPLRLFPRLKGKFHGKIHESLVLEAGISVKKLNATLDHYSYKNLDDYFEKFNKYTSSVAKNHFDANKKAPPHFIQVLRYLGEFVWRYVFRLGFLDGYPGFVFALLGSTYVFTKYAKLELLYKEQESHR